MFERKIHNVRIDTIEDVEQWLFPMLESITAAAGGDGDGYVVSENYKELAEKYDKWRMWEPPNYIDLNVPRQLKRLGYYFKRHDRENDVLFSDESNENIVFCNDAKQLPPWGEIIYL